MDASDYDDDLFEAESADEEQAPPPPTDFETTSDVAYNGSGLIKALLEETDARKVCRCRAAPPE